MRIPAAIAGLLLALIWACPPAQAVSVRLNAPLGIGRQVMTYKVSPDGRRVVYVADQDTDNVMELYGVPIAGGTPVKLNGPLSDGWDASSGSFFISPDSSRVVFQTHDSADENTALYSVPITGGTAVQLNGQLPLGGNVMQVQISPDSSRVVYRADEDVNEDYELFSVRLDGTDQVQLSGVMVAGGDVGTTFRISPDSSRVVYLADQLTDGVNELFSVPLAGGAWVGLNGNVATGGDVTSSFEISPAIDANPVRVVYISDEDIDNTNELFSAPILGGPRTQLNGSLLAGRNVITFSISPDGERVVYRADQDADEVFELYGAPIGGGPVTKLNPALVSGGDVGSSGYDISPDSSRLVFIADQAADEVQELFSVDIAGGTPVKLNAPLAALGNVTDFLISPDSATVVYRADQETDQDYYIYGVPLAGGSTPVRLNASMPAGRSVGNHYAISPRGGRVVYQADPDAVNVYDLFGVPLAGGTPVQINPQVAFGSVVNESATISPDGRRVVYRADQDTDNVYELYSAPLAPLGVPYLLMLL